jgi:hypothetical protein
MVIEEFESWLKYGVIMTLVKRKKCPGGLNTQNTTNYNIKLKRNENARVFARPVLASRWMASTSVFLSGSDSGVTARDSQRELQNQDT